MRALARIGRMIVARFQGATRLIADAWKKARELERTRAEETRKASEPHIALPSDDEATILGGDSLAESGEHDVAPEPSAIPPVTRVRIASAEAFPEQSPLILSEPSPKKSRAASIPPPADPEAAKSRSRRRKTDDEPAEAPASIEAKIEMPAEPAKKSRRKKAPPPPEVSVEEAIEQAGEDEEDEDDDAGEEELADKAAALPVTPLESIDVESKKKPRAPAPAKKEPAFAGITIVDTSAALEKDAPAVEAPKPEKPKEKKARRRRRPSSSRRSTCSCPRPRTSARSSTRRSSARTQSSS